jgi:oxalate---CoA ligase
MSEILDRSDGSVASMCEAVCHWAAATPEAPAIFAEDRKPLPYKDLLTGIETIGARLNALGIGRADRVAVLHPGGADLAVAVLGIWSVATAAPLNPNYTLGEFVLYLRELRVTAVVIAEGMDSPARLAADRLGLPVLEIVPTRDDVAGTIALQGPATGPAVQSDPAASSDIALLLTTSGTTSHSKIVPIRHSELLARCRNAGRRLGLRPGDRCLNLMPLYHSHGLNTGLGVSVVTGGGVMPMTVFDVAGFFRSLDSLQPTWFTAVFTFHHQIHAHAKAHEDAVARSRLRFIHTSSGRLEPRIADDLESWFGVPILGTYASTETGVMTGDSPPPALRKRGSVGTPACDEVAVVDRAGRPLPPGERGEVCVRGANVFRGYENSDATDVLTADGWFRTGDEGMFDEDGFLFLTGRVRETINRGGEKISPSEIDAAILRHPAVATATAFPIPHPTLGAEAAAAVVLNVGAALDEKRLTDFLRQHLAGFKVPRRILFVDDIPKGPTGKIQRHALAAAFGLDAPAAQVSTTAPDDGRSATPLERKLQRIWAKTLKQPHVGLHDDFFLLGGDSLQAVELFLEIEKTLGRRLPRAVLFEASTVAEMAGHIESEMPSTCLVPIQPDGSRPPFFCVHNLHGEVLNFRALTMRLGTDQPFYALQGVGMDGMEAPLGRIEDMAARYIAEMRRVQPEGPYFIGGYSMGGLVAYEMAQQLRAAGETVALLALLDAYQHRGRHPASPLRWFDYGGDPLADRRLWPLAAYGMRRVRSVFLNLGTETTRGLFGAAWRSCERLGRPIPRLLHRPIAANILAVRSYRMKPYDGDAVLFTAERYPWDRKDWDKGWHELIHGRLDIEPVPGVHHEMLDEPHVPILARKLSDRLPAGRSSATTARFRRTAN